MHATKNATGSVDQGHLVDDEKKNWRLYLMIRKSSYDGDFSKEN